MWSVKYFFTISWDFLKFFSQHLVFVPNVSKPLKYKEKRNKKPPEA